MDQQNTLFPSFPALVLFPEQGQGAQVAPVTLSGFLQLSLFLSAPLCLLKQAFNHVI